MRYRKLRISWSIGWGLLATLLLALWVRSYSTGDIIAGNLPDEYSSFNLASLCGELGLSIVDDGSGTAIAHMTIPPSHPYFAHPKYCSPWGFKYANGEPPGVFLIVVPFWLVVWIPAVIAPISWLPMPFKGPAFARVAKRRGASHRRLVRIDCETGPVKNYPATRKYEVPASDSALC